MKLVLDGIRAAAVVFVVAAVVAHGTRPLPAVPQFVAREGAVVVVEGEGGVPLRMRELAAAAAAISAAVCGGRGHLGGSLGLLEAFDFRELAAAGVDEPVGDLVWLVCWSDYFLFLVSTRLGMEKKDSLICSPVSRTIACFWSSVG